MAIKKKTVVKKPKSASKKATKSVSASKSRVKSAKKAPVSKKPVQKSIAKKKPAPKAVIQKKETKSTAKKAIVKKTPVVKKAPIVKKAATKSGQKTAAVGKSKPVVKTAAKTTTVAKTAAKKPVNHKVEAVKPKVAQKPVKKEPVKAAPAPANHTATKVEETAARKTAAKKAPTSKPKYIYRPEPSILDLPEENNGPRRRYSDNELQEFKDLIQRKLESARKELVYLQGLITRKDEAGTDDTENKYMGVEDGSGTMEREQLSQLASRQIQYIDHLEKALVRIENKTYGICRVTGKLIDKARLRAVPHATLSIEAKLANKK